MEIIGILFFFVAEISEGVNIDKKNDPQRSIKKMDRSF